MLAVIDYGAGTLRSVTGAVRQVGCDFEVTTDPKVIESASGVILPGVGAAADTMNGLASRGLLEPAREAIESGRPYLGICMGLQILFESSEEDGGTPCLGIYEGTVRRFPEGLHVPHVGWNQVRQKVAHPIFHDIPDASNFYFVHSYYAEAGDPSLVAGETDYDVTFCSALVRGRLVATQFHPEKSGALGLVVYRNFLRMALEDGEWR